MLTVLVFQHGATCRYEPLLFSHSTVTRGSKAAKAEVKQTKESDSTNKTVKDLEGEFFYLNKTGKNEKVQQQGPSELERMLRVLASEHKKRCSGPSTAAYFSHVTGLKREFFALRRLWAVLYERVSALDELAQCARKLQLEAHRRQQDGPVPEAEKHAWVDNIDQKELFFKNELTVHGQEMKTCFGRLTYLTNLKERAEQPNAAGASSCPICLLALKEHYGVLVCGHMCCLTCLHEIYERNKAKKVRCPTCRANTVVQQIEYVSVQQSSEEQDVTINGDHSAKISGIVRQLKRIRVQQDKEKALVFSQWNPVLDLVDAACQDNGMQALKLYGCSRVKRQENLERFKNDPSVAVLLVPTKSGSGGLNLTEASHVLLVEPLLNPAIELQAVGRVHRIGQTRETHVHHFLMNETVEENVLHQQSLMRTFKPVQTSPSKKSAAINETAGLTVGEFQLLFEQRTPSINPSATKDNGGATKAHAPKPSAEAPKQSGDANSLFWGKCTALGCADCCKMRIPATCHLPRHVSFTRARVHVNVLSRPLQIRAFSFAAAL